MVKDSCITLEGPLTVDSVPLIFKKPLVLDNDFYQVNLKGVSEIDSAGMALLLYWWTRCKEQNCRLEFDHCPEKLRQIAVVSGLESVFLDASPLE